MIQVFTDSLINIFGCDLYVYFGKQCPWGTDFVAWEEKFRYSITFLKVAGCLSFLRWLCGDLIDSAQLQKTKLEPKLEGSEREHLTQVKNKFLSTRAAGRPVGRNEIINSPRRYKGISATWHTGGAGWSLQHPVIPSKEDLWQTIGIQASKCVPYKSDTCSQYMLVDNFDSSLKQRENGGSSQWAKTWLQRVMEKHESISSSHLSMLMNKELILFQRWTFERTSKWRHQNLCGWKMSSISSRCGWMKKKNFNLLKTDKVVARVTTYKKWAMLKLGWTISPQKFFETSFLILSRRR